LVWDFSRCILARTAFNVVLQGLENDMKCALAQAFSDPLPGVAVGHAFWKSAAQAWRTSELSATDWADAAQARKAAAMAAEAKREKVMRYSDRTSRHHTRR